MKPIHNLSIGEGPVAHRIGELQGLMGDRYSQYWRGPKADALQQEYRDLIERRAEGESPSRPDVSGLLKVHDDSKLLTDRIRELQGLMGDRVSEYWKGPKAEALQQEYRNLIEMRGDGGLLGPPDDAASENPENAEYRDPALVEDRVRELQSLMGDRHSEYWKGPKANSLQAEFRDLIRARNKLRPPESASTFAMAP